MKQLLNVFPHEVTITKSVVNTCEEQIKWLSSAGFVQGKDFSVNWVNPKTVEFGFKKPRLAMEFKLAWG